MNAFQKCRSTSDAVPLYLPHQLFLKPIAQLSITVQLPEKLVGKSVSNWELMEKIRELIKPDEFSVLQVSKSTLEYIKFEAEIDDKNKINKIITKLHNKVIKLKEFNELFKLKAFETRQDFPNKHVWDSFFREAKDMNEMKPGERPDTVHISNLPIRWFVPHHLSKDEHAKPSEKVFHRIFEKFGRIRHVDIPICDPYRKEMKSYMSGLQTFSFDEKDFFEGYIQFKDYGGFLKTMNAFRCMKLLRKDKELFENYTVNIKVDFDKSKHMSESSIKRREIVRERLIRKKQKEEEKAQLEKEEEKKKQESERQRLLDLKKEKEKRRREREESRKMKILAELKSKGADEINAKIAKEEKKLLRAQRKLEAIRLVEELFRRIKLKHDDLDPSERNKGYRSEITEYKTTSEKELQTRQDKLHQVIESRVVLKTILGSQTKERRASTSSDSSISLHDDGEIEKIKVAPPLDGAWYGIPQQNGLLPYLGALPHSIRGNPHYYHPYPKRGRGYNRGAGPSRGYRNRNFRGRNRNIYYPPELQEQYYRYFNKFLRNDSRSRSYSRSESRSRSRSRGRSRSERDNYRSRSRSRRSYSRSRSSSRTKSYSRRSRSRKDRSKSRSRSKERKCRSLSKKSDGSSKFISPRSLRREKSKSVETTEKRSPWSDTSSPKK